MIESHVKKFTIMSPGSATFIEDYVAPTHHVMVDVYITDHPASTTASSTPAATTTTPAAAASQRSTLMVSSLTTSHLGFHKFFQSLFSSWFGIWCSYKLVASRVNLFQSL